MSNAQLLDDPRSQADLGVQPSSYYGQPLQQFDNLAGFRYLDPSNGPLTRHSYVFQAIYQIGSGPDKEYGGIQLRGRLHGYGDVPERVQAWIEEAAHRAAYMYDSGVQTSQYGPAPTGTRGTQGGDGYLTGFNIASTFRNREHEEITDTEQQTPVGVIDWSTEVYVDDSFDDAELSGIAQGLANPYQADHRVIEGDEPVHIPPTKWQIEWEAGRDPPEYVVTPEPYTAARDRYREGAGAGKTVYVNGLPIGSLGPKGRVWLRPEYQRGSPEVSKGSWGTYHSRQGLIERTAATPQALRKGGVLYQTGETEDGVYLTTRRARPDGWTEIDPNQVPVDLDVHPGSDDREVYLLKLQPHDAGLPCECRRDEQLIRHLGRSHPPYQHQLGDRQRWP